MDFDINVWLEMRAQANKIGEELNSFRDEQGKIQLSKFELDEYIEKITEILRCCSVYMDRHGMKMPRSKWKYNIKNEATHVSSEHFAYHHLR